MAAGSQSSLEAGNDGFNDFAHTPLAWPKRTLLPVVTRISSRLTSRPLLRILSLICLIPILVYIFVPYEHIKASYAMTQGHPRGSKNAFAVLLAANTRSGVDQEDMESDPYFQATRVLHYQIKHSVSTRFTDSNAPFLVLVTPEVAQNKRDVLKREGATIIPVENIKVDWISAGLGSGAWTSVLTKLQLWRLTEYDRILCIDSDTLLIKSLNGIFDDPAAQLRETRHWLADKSDNTTAHMPQTFVFGGIQEGINGNRVKPVNTNYLNAGFFMLKPDMNMYIYYMELLSVPNLFNPSMPEQNLFNHAHRKDGPMPWQHLDERWNTNCPSYNDLVMGWKTVHGKHWQLNFKHADKGDAGRCDVDPVLGTTWWRTRGHMESFYAKQAV